MKYLEARKQEQTPSIVPEHKMAPGPRGKLDPSDPASLVSSPHKSTKDVRNEGRVKHTRGATATDEKVDES